MRAARVPLGNGMWRICSWCNERKNQRMKGKEWKNERIRRDIYHRLEKNKKIFSKVWQPNLAGSDTQEKLIIFNYKNIQQEFIKHRIRKIIAKLNFPKNHWHACGVTWLGMVDVLQAMCKENGTPGSRDATRQANPICWRELNPWQLKNWLSCISISKSGEQTGRGSCGKAGAWATASWWPRYRGRCPPPHGLPGCTPWGGTDTGKRQGRKGTGRRDTEPRMAAAPPRTQKLCA